MGEAEVPSSYSSSSSSSEVTTGTSSSSDKDSPPPPVKKAKPSLETAEPNGTKATNKKKVYGSGDLVTNGAVASRPATTSKLSKPSLLEPSEDDGERDKVLEMAEGRVVYKSLFSSNTAARPKEKTSNWVTFFPYH